MCQNETDYNDAIKCLKTSPMFNLSLSSNELFHSNFLYWIWKADQETFKSIINKLIGENDYWEKNWGNKNIEVRREYKNFDLSIVEVCSNTDDSKKDSNTTEYKTQEDQGDYNTDGLILFVLENKVKSIPYAQQLLKYNNKIDQHNEALNEALLKKEILNEKSKGRWSNKWKEDLEKRKTKLCCKKVLLSLTDTSPDITLDDNNCFKGWKRRSYDEYLSYLQPINEQLGCTPDKKDLSKYQNIFDDYCKYIENLSICIKEWNKFIDPKTNEINLQTKFGDYPYMETAENLRLHALYSQYNYAKLCCILMQKLEAAGLSNVQYIRMQDDVILLTGEDKKKRGKFENYNDYFKDKDVLIGVGYDYTNKTPLLEVKVVKKANENQDKLIYIIQVQGNSYEHGIIRKGSKSDVEDYIEKNDEIKTWVSTKKDNNIFADNKVCDKYNGYNGTYSMVYKYRKIDPKRPTKDVIDYIVADVKKLLEQLNK